MALRNSGLGAMNPEFPTTGSRIIAAISPLLVSKRYSTADMSLKGAVRVSKVAPFGTPGESGSPKVATALPALTRNGSPWPW